MWGFIEALQKPRANLMAHSMLNPQVHASLDSAARIATGNPTLAGAAGATATRQSGKLLLNQILNHVTRRGPFLGNSAGVLAMTYNLMNAYAPPSFVHSGMVADLAGAWKHGHLFQRL